MKNTLRLIAATLLISLAACQDKTPAPTPQKVAVSHKYVAEGK